MRELRESAGLAWWNRARMEVGVIRGDGIKIKGTVMKVSEGLSFEGI